METSFYSQNTQRFYPFDENQISVNRSTYSECNLDIIRQGIVDLGIVVLDSELFTADIAGTAVITKVDTQFMLAVDIARGAKNYSLIFTFAAPTAGYITVKAIGSGVYGFLTLGEPDIWQTWSNTITVPIYRECIKMMVGRQLSKLTVKNKDRWLPTHNCIPNNFGERVEEWSYGAIASGSVILRPGFNCSLRFNERENSVTILPFVGAGMGVVSQDVTKGYDDNDALEPQSETGRFDDLDPNKRYVKSFGGAYGEPIHLSYDKNFRVKVHPLDNEIGGNCPKDILEISYIRDGLDDCLPLFTDLFGELNTNQIVLPCTPLDGQVMGVVMLPESIAIDEAPNQPLLAEINAINTTAINNFDVNVAGLRFLPSEDGKNYKGVQLLIDYKVYPENEDDYFYYDIGWDIWIYGEIKFKVNVSMEGSYGKYRFNQTDDLRKWQITVKVTDTEDNILCEESREVETGDWT